VRAPVLDPTDGVHFNIRLENDRLCTLVMIGALPNGEKELLAVEDGYRESAESWKTVLRELKGRGMAAPVLAVGDGALGLWAAAREVWPETREQGCWCHKLVNVLDKLPKRLQPRAKRALHEMIYAERRADCEAAKTSFSALQTGQPRDDAQGSGEVSERPPGNHT
jgi:putative transposase